MDSQMVYLTITVSIRREKLSAVIGCFSLATEESYLFAEHFFVYCYIGTTCVTVYTVYPYLITGGCGRGEFSTFLSAYYMWI